MESDAFLHGFCQGLLAPLHTIDSLLGGRSKSPTIIDPFKEDRSIDADSEQCREEVLRVPEPAVLKEFEAVLPGSAERVLRFSEREQEHRLHIERQKANLENAMTRSAAGLELAGQAAGMLVMTGSSLTALYFSAIERDLWFATLFYFPVMITMMTALIGGRQLRRQE